MLKCVCPRVGTLTCSRMNTFDSKLKAGLQGEEIARVYLESLGHIVSNAGGISLDSLRASDLLVNGTPTEVKLDILASKTGNICIEHRSLETHTAPYYVWIVPTFYRIKKEDLEWLVANPDFRVTEIGDDKRAGTLVPLNHPQFNKYFHLIK
jgi:hypothetical protein